MLSYQLCRRLSVDLVPTNGKRMVYLDNVSPRGQEQASHVAAQLGFSRGWDLHDDDDDDDDHDDDDDSRHYIMR